MPKSRIFSVANMSFNAIRENKLFAKFSEFTIAHCLLVSSADNNCRKFGPHIRPNVLSNPNHLKRLWYSWLECLGKFYVNFEKQISE